MTAPARSTTFAPHPSPPPATPVTPAGPARPGARKRRRASAAWEGLPAIRVATLPGRSVYARHLTHPEGVDRVHRGTVGFLGAPARPGEFDPGWLAGALGGLDVVHVLGLPPYRPDAERRLDAALTLVREAGVPLVVTAYHLTDPSRTDARLGRLLSQADAVLTLTDAAADLLAAEHGVSADVIAHPHALDFVRMRSPVRPRTATLRVGLHLGALTGGTGRPARAALRLAGCLSRAVRRAPGRTALRLSVHDGLADPASTSYAPEALRRLDGLARAAGGSLVLGPAPTESQMWDLLAGVDVAVLAPDVRSHSVLPEACADLGVEMIAPSGSLAAAQALAWPGARPPITYQLTGAATEDSLVEALTEAHRRGVAFRSDPVHRWGQRVAAAAAHRTLFESLLARRGWSAPG